MGKYCSCQNWAGSDIYCEIHGTPRPIPNQDRVCNETTVMLAMGYGDEKCQHCTSGRVDVLVHKKGERERKLCKPCVVEIVFTAMQKHEKLPTV